MKGVNAQNVRIHKLHLKDLCTCNTELDGLTEMSMEEIIAECPPRDKLGDIMEWVFGDDSAESEESDEHDYPEY